MDNKSNIDCYIQSLIGGRSENQDYAGVMDTNVGTVVVVCDGMGALNGGSTASKIAVTTVIEYVAGAQADFPVTEVLKSAVIRANDAILDAAENDEELAGMGTTLTAVIINDDCATVAYVGDSRVYQLRGKEKVFRTFDHSLVFQSVKVGLITEEQARLSSQSNVITKALGIGRDLEVEVFELPYLSGDRFVLCTDGFWGAMPEKEFIAKIARGKLAHILEKTAIQIDLMGIRHGSHHDNLTAAMFDVKKDSKRKVKMSTKHKILLILLSLSLLVSVSLNIYQLSKQDNPSQQSETDSKEFVDMKSDQILDKESEKSVIEGNEGINEVNTGQEESVKVNEDMNNEISEPSDTSSKELSKQ